MENNKEKKTITISLKTFIIMTIIFIIIVAGALGLYINGLLRKSENKDIEKQELVKDEPEKEDIILDKVDNKEFIEFSQTDYEIVKVYKDGRITFSVTDLWKEYFNNGILEANKEYTITGVPNTSNYDIKILKYTEQTYLEPYIFITCISEDYRQRSTYSVNTIKGFKTGKFEAKHLIDGEYTINNTLIGNLEEEVNGGYYYYGPEFVSTTSSMIYHVNRDNNGEITLREYKKEDEHSSSSSNQINYPNTKGAIFEYSIDTINESVKNKLDSVSYINLKCESNTYAISQDRTFITIHGITLDFDKEIYHACVYPIGQGGTEMWAVLFRDGTVKYTTDWGKTIKDLDFNHVIDMFPITYRRETGDEIGAITEGTILVVNEYGAMMDLSQIN